MQLEASFSARVEYADALSQLGLRHFDREFKIRVIGDHDSHLVVVDEPV